MDDNSVSRADGRDDRKSDGRHVLVRSLRSPSHVIPESLRWRWRGSRSRTMRTAPEVRPPPRFRHLAAELRRHRRAGTSGGRARSIHQPFREMALPHIRLPRRLSFAHPLRRRPDFPMLPAEASVRRRSRDARPGPLRPSTESRRVARPHRHRRWCGTTGRAGRQCALAFQANSVTMVAHAEQRGAPGTADTTSGERPHPRSGRDWTGNANESVSEEGARCTAGTRRSWTDLIGRQTGRCGPFG